MPKRQARELPRRRYRIDLHGELEGYHVVMGAMWGREIIALQRGEMDEAGVLDLVAERCHEHDFEIDDLRDLDGWMLGEILDGWKQAMTETALPPTPAESSPSGSAA